MNIEYYGPFIRISFKANEIVDPHVSVKLAPGYTYERILINNLFNITELHAYQSVAKGDRFTFPPVNSKSPSVLHLFIPDVTKSAEIRFSIEKFGQIPDEHYFETAFKPILVTGDNGNKYKIIPSDQFK